MSTERLRDGTTGYFTRRGDDCWPAAVATCLQVPIGELPDLRLDERLATGMAPDAVDKAARGDAKRWLTARGLRLVEHDRPRPDLPRWVGVIPFDGWFVSHCVVMSRGEVLFDPTPPIPPREAVQMSLRSGLPLRRRVWRADEVTEGFSFSRCPTNPKE